MKGIIWADGRRAFGIWFWAAVLLVTPLVLMDCAVDFAWLFQDRSVFLEQGSVYYYHFNSVQFGGLYGRYLVGMLAVVPYGAAFCREYEGGMAPLAAARCGRKKYFRSKFGVGVLAGGLACGLGMCLLFGMLRALGLPLFQEYELQNLAGLPFLRNQGSRWGYFAWAAFFATMEGSLYAGAAIWVSGYVQNGYVVHVSPVLLRFAMIQAARVLRLPNEWRLDRLLCMRVWIGSEVRTAALAVAVVVLLLTLAGKDFERRGRRVLEGG